MMSKPMKSNAELHQKEEEEEESFDNTEETKQEKSVSQLYHVVWEDELHIPECKMLESVTWFLNYRLWDNEIYMLHNLGFTCPCIHSYCDTYSNKRQQEENKESPDVYDDPKLRGIAWSQEHYYNVTRGKNGCFHCSLFLCSSPSIEPTIVSWFVITILFMRGIFCSDCMKHLQHLRLRELVMNTYIEYLHSGNNSRDMQLERIFAILQSPPRKFYLSLEKSSKNDKIEWETLLQLSKKLSSSIQIPSMFLA